jgi:hypothetical protein
MMCIVGIASVEQFASVSQWCCIVGNFCYFPSERFQASLSIVSMSGAVSLATLDGTHSEVWCRS